MAKIGLKIKLPVTIDASQIIDVVVSVMTGSHKLLLLLLD